MKRLIQGLEDSLDDDESVLTGRHVAEVFNACVSNTEKDCPTCGGTDEVTVEGIVHTATFDRAKLADYDAEIGAMLAELPEEFREDNPSGGWSFLNACMDRHGRQWTGLHFVQEQLLLLGLATDQVRFLLPREMWSALPGSMPYFVLTKDRR